MSEDCGNWPGEGYAQRALAARVEQALSAVERLGRLLSAMEDSAADPATLALLREELNTACDERSRLLAEEIRLTETAAR